MYWYYRNVKMTMQNVSWRDTEAVIPGWSRKPSTTQVVREFESPSLRHNLTLEPYRQLCRDNTKMRHMQSILVKSLLFSFTLTNLSFLIKRPVICEGGSLFVTSISPSCVGGTITYFLRGWPIEFFWSNKTGFVLEWYLADMLLYLILGLFIFSLIIPIFNKLVLKK